MFMDILYREIKFEENFKLPFRHHFFITDNTKKSLQNKLWENKSKRAMAVKYPNFQNFAFNFQILL